VDEQIPQNASNIYTFSFEAKIYAQNKIKGSEQAFITINGEDKLPMERQSPESNLFTYEYAAAQGVSEFRYYYELHYDYKTAASTGQKTLYSTHEQRYGRPYQAKLINRYPIQLISSRGRVGDKINIVGTGFSDFDKVIIGGIEAETTFNHETSLGFIVPALNASQSYEILLRTGTGDIKFGQFRVDEGTLKIFPRSLDLTSGDVGQLTFEIEGIAPKGGFYIDVKTNIADSLIMPEVIIDEGFSSKVVTIEGGEAGTGYIEVKAPGYPKQRIPVTVR